MIGFRASRAIFAAVADVRRQRLSKSCRMLLLALSSHVKLWLSCRSVELGLGVVRESIHNTRFSEWS